MQDPFFLATPENWSTKPVANIFPSIKYDLFSIYLLLTDRRICLFDLILYVPSTIFQLNRDRSSWVEPVLSYDKCVLLKDHNAVMLVRLHSAAPRSWVKNSTTDRATALPESENKSLWNIALSCHPPLPFLTFVGWPMHLKMSSAEVFCYK